MPPHVTLIYPFVDDVHLDDAAIAALRDLLAVFAPFESRFATFARFDAARPVLYVEPEPAGAYLDLMTAIAARFPDHPPYGGVHETVIPHLTVAESDDLAALDAAEVAVSRHLPLVARVAEVDVMEHRGADGWCLHTALPLE
jgi:2'-5' RNA ligase